VEFCTHPAGLRAGQVVGVGQRACTQFEARH
jgi:hypothetical protein